MHTPLTVHADYLFFFSCFDLSSQCSASDDQIATFQAFLFFLTSETQLGVAFPLASIFVALFLTDDRGSCCCFFFYLSSCEINLETLATCHVQI